MWARFINEVANKGRVIAIDLPGHGQSDVVSDEHSMELLAEIVHELMRSLEITSVSLIGHSMGGYVALAYLELYHKEVNNIILLNSTSRSDSAERRLNRNRALAIIQKNAGSFINSAIYNLFAPVTANQYSSEISKLQAEARRFPANGIAAMIRGMKNRKDRTQILKKFNGPKYIICGTEDPIIPLNESKTISEITNSHLIIVEGGHMILIENWAEFVKIVHFIDFL